MGKTTKTAQTTIRDPQDHPISKQKTMMYNLNSYIRMLNSKFPDMSSKQYIKNVHRFIDKIKRKLKRTDQHKLIQARQKIKICKTCDSWSGNKPMVQCSLCEDNYHVKCLKKTPSDYNKNSKKNQTYQWTCEQCQSILKTQKQTKNSYLEKFNQIKDDCCNKCDKMKKQFETFIICIKCNFKYHKQCYGKAIAVCYQCDQTISMAIYQKQPSLLEFNFERKTESFKKRKGQQSAKHDNTKSMKKKFSQYQQKTSSPKKLFGRQIEEKQEKYIDESTQASTNPFPLFNKCFPPLTPQQIQEYKTSLLYAIAAKSMLHCEQLKPIECSLQDDTEESLDFGLQHMNPIELQVYKQYKKQPFGPYKFIYIEGMGYDVVADKDLPKGMLVCEYVGDVVTYREIINNQLLKGHNDSLFELRAGANADQTLYIRPQKFTNMGRFINGVNSQTGRGKINVASVRMLAKGKPGVFLYTTRKIKKGESLAYDYNGFFNNYPTSDFL